MEGWRGAGGLGLEEMEGWRVGEGRVGGLEVRYRDVVSCAVDFCDAVFCRGDTVR